MKTRVTAILLLAVVSLETCVHRFPWALCPCWRRKQSRVCWHKADAPRFKKQRRWPPGPQKRSASSRTLLDEAANRASGRVCVGPLKSSPLAFNTHRQTNRLQFLASRSLPSGRVRAKECEMWPACAVLQPTTFPPSLGHPGSGVMSSTSVHHSGHRWMIDCSSQPSDRKLRVWYLYGKSVQLADSSWFYYFSCNMDTWLHVLRMMEPDSMCHINCQSMSSPAWLVLLGVWAKYSSHLRKNIQATWKCWDLMDLADSSL